MDVKNVMRIPLTAGQSVSVYGWLQPRETLNWTTVLANPKLTFSYLHLTLKVSRDLLYRLQPDIAAWVSAERVTLDDMPLLTQWGAHPIRDFKSDLADLIGMEWDATVMQKCGVTYQELKELHMTPINMQLFGYTLYEWNLLGFKSHDAMEMTAPELTRLFGMTKGNVLRALADSKN